MKKNKWIKIVRFTLMIFFACFIWGKLPIICFANNFNAWNHLGEQPSIYSFYTVGGNGLYILLRKIVVYGSTLCVFFGLVVMMVIKNPKVVLQRKQDIIDKLALIIYASGSITFLNLLYRLCNAIFY